MTSEIAPHTKFKHPREILEARDLSQDQKIKYLRQMEYDLRDRLIASDESMTGPQPGMTAKLIRSVRKALQYLDVKAEETGGAATRSGAA